MLTAITVALAGGTLLLLAAAMSLALGWASRAFHVEVDPRVEAVEAALPGANCAGCGYVGCAAYAEAVVSGEAAPTLCAPGGPACAEAVGEILGIDVEPTWPYRAVVHCAATAEQRLGHNPYEGEATCAAANLVADVQGCVYGCLGLGDCVRACEYDALAIVDALAVIDYRNCTGCGACVDACPRHIISRVPFKAERIPVVACSNQDFGAEVRKVCEVGCIGCTKCAQGTALLTMRDRLPVIDYEAWDPAGEEMAAMVAKCPMESLLWIGKPREEDLEATEDEELARPATAAFESTVDRTSWWG